MLVKESIDALDKGRQNAVQCWVLNVGGAATAMVWYRVAGSRGTVLLSTQRADHKMLE